MSYVFYTLLGMFAIIGIVFTTLAVVCTFSKNYHFMVYIGRTNTVKHWMTATLSRLETH